MSSDLSEVRYPECFVFASLSAFGKIFITFFLFNTYLYTKKCTLGSD